MRLTILDPFLSLCSFTFRYSSLFFGILLVGSTSHLLRADKLDTLPQGNPHLQQSIDEIRTYSRSGKVDTANTLALALLEATQGQGDNALSQVYGILGEINLVSNQLAEADSLFNLAIELSSEDSLDLDYLLCKATTAIRTGNLDSLSANLDRAEPLLGPTPKDLHIHYYYSARAYEYNVQNDLVEAINQIQIAKRLLVHDSTLSTRANHNLSSIYLKLLDYQSSLVLLEENLKIAKANQDIPLLVNSYYGIAEANLKLENIQETKAACFQAIELKEKTGYSPHFGFLYRILGEAYLREGKLDSAYQSFQQGVELSEARQEITELCDNYEGMVSLFLTKGDTAKALAFAEKALAINTQQRDELNYEAAIMYQARGEYPKASELLMQNWSEYKKRNEEEVLAKVIQQYQEERFSEESKRKELEVQKQISTQRSQFAILLLSLAGVFGLVVILLQSRHVKKLRRTSQELAEKNEELEQFNYITSHDLQEPIQTISNFSKLLLEKYSERVDDTGIKSLEYINRASDRIKKQIDSLLEYSLIGQSGTASPVDTQELVSDLLEDLKSSINEHDAKIERGALPNVQGHKAELRALFQNLLSNAIKFRKPDTQPKIAIDCKEMEGCWKFSIQDNGIGIPDGNKDKIFGIFQRLHGSDSYDGVGIGLAHCKKIVDLHQGKIWVEDNPGGGSTFYFSVRKS